MARVTGCLETGASRVQFKKRTGQVKDQGADSGDFGSDGVETESIAGKFEF